MNEITFKVTLTDPMLGTLPNNPEIAADYVASKNPNAYGIEEEISRIGVDGVIEKGKTVFPRENGEPILYDYQIKGFFKEAIGVLKDVKGSPAYGLKAHKKKVDNFLFVFPRCIRINVNGEMTDCQRPLRAMTPMGERVSLANSEQIPAGSTFEFTVKLLNEDLFDSVIAAMDYSELKGFGQWRNSGKGRATYEILGVK